MPHIIIDGQRIEAQNGKTIIQAAYDNGMQIPHFCWHPELSVAGNCRMCLVEVGTPRRNREGQIEGDENGEAIIAFIPKLQIACATPISDGMVVLTKSHKAIEAQEAVMEFLLINHPLDCPICDEAGECKLQEYAFKHSKGQSRFDEQKTHKVKHQEWGPNVVYDAERCISCSRCIRYAQEVAHQDVLTFVQRGDHVTIELFEDTKFDNPYSMNVIEICPVGALTSKDFRFKSRVWDMSFNPSITPADGSGNNISLGIRNNEILRIEPRTNMYVNKYWLTDDQRLNHHQFVNENRVTEPLIRNNGELSTSNWNDAIDQASNLIRKYQPHEIMVMASARMTNEDAYIAQKFVKSIMKTQNLDFLPHVIESMEDGHLSSRDRRPNTTGLTALGLKANNAATISKENLQDKLRVGAIKLLYVIEEDFADYSNILHDLEAVETIIVHSYNNNALTEKATIVFPTSTFAEIEGTYTNVKGRVQHFTPALVTKENLRFMGLKMSRLDKFGAYNDNWTKHEHRNSRQSWKIIQAIAKAMGENWDYKKSEEIFDEIQDKNTAFNGMSYKLLDEYQGLNLNRSGKPDAKVRNYVSHVMKPH